MVFFCSSAKAPQSFPWRGVWLYLRVNLACWSCGQPRRWLLWQAAHLLKMSRVGPGPPCHSQVSSVMGTQTPFYSFTNHVLVRWPPNPDDPNQASADILHISFISTILHMPQTPYQRAWFIADYWGCPLVCSYFILLSNITPLWRNTASITIS